MRATPIVACHPEIVFSRTHASGPTWFGSAWNTVHVVQRKLRVPIPSDVAAETLFRSDRTCCVCHVPGRQVQIHHINDDPSDNDPYNLAVLCLECHGQTQVSGGFGRKLNADLVTLYRDDWLTFVEARRAAELYKSNQIKHVEPNRPDVSETDTPQRASSRDRARRVWAAGVDEAPKPAYTHQFDLLVTSFAQQSKRNPEMLAARQAVTDITHEFTGAIKRATLKSRIAKSSSELAQINEELADEALPIATQFSIQAYKLRRLESETHQEIRVALGLMKEIPRARWNDGFLRWLASVRRWMESSMEFMDSLQRSYDTTNARKRTSSRLDSILDHMQDAKMQMLKSRDGYQKLLEELDALGF